MEDYVRGYKYQIYLVQEQEAKASDFFCAEFVGIENIKLTNIQKKKIKRRTVRLRVETD